MMVIDGGCLCGRARYRVEGRLLYANHCHCSMCRRQHGAALATYAGVDPAGFKWTRGADMVRVFETETGAGWCFCRQCGSSLAGTLHGEITSITLGTVDGDPQIKPESHIYVGSKASWHDLHDDLIQFEERPPESWDPPRRDP